MDKNDLIKRCLKFQDAVETYPFKDKTYDEYAVLRHKTNGKWFGLVFYLNNRLCINLKCNPVDSAILRDEYKFITPAWHMNKTDFKNTRCDEDYLDFRLFAVNSKLSLINASSKSLGDLFTSTIIQ